MALYYRDPETGEHVITHDAEELRFSSRAQALEAVHDLQSASNAVAAHPAQRSRQRDSRRPT